MTTPRQPRLPKGAIKPRPSVLRMAPYSPPTGGRAGKLRLDFNENTVGCSPQVIGYLRESLDAAKLAVYPEYGEAKQCIANFFGVHPDQFVFTNGTDEAIQVFMNTYVDDGAEVLVLRPSYAMYRFYAEVAGATVREVDYRPPQMEFPLQEVLAAITPSTRAVLIANPNNPTGTGVTLLAIERILKRARRAVVFIDEAYFEFCGVTALNHIGTIPNLFVSRTFSKVFGMAAMRLGCLFSHQANVAYLHKAQSPYSVNSLAVLAATAAVRDTAYVERYVAEVLAARELLSVGLERLGISYVPSSGNFVLGNFGKRAIEVRDYLRGRGILVRDRSYEVPGHVRITVGTREQTRLLLATLEEILVKPYLIFDMDGVLVDVTESYRETICRTVLHFTGEPIAREAIQDLKNQGGWNDDWRLSHHIIASRGVEAPFSEVVGRFQSIFRGNGVDGLIMRERWIARPGLLERFAENYRLALFTGRECEEAAVTLARFAPQLCFSPIVGMESVENHKPHPEGLLKILGGHCGAGNENVPQEAGRGAGRGPGGPPYEHGPGAATPAGAAGRKARPHNAWYIGDTIDDARCASSAGVPFIGIAAPASPRYRELLDAFRAEGVATMLDDINSLEAVLPL